MRICLGILRADDGEVRWDGARRPTSRAARGATSPKSAASTRGWPSSTSSSTSPRSTASRPAGAREARRLARPLPDRRIRGPPRRGAVARATSRRSSSSPRSCTSREVLLMDEPFTGLDPVNLALLREAFIELRDRGPDVVFSTHQMEAAEALCESRRDRRPRPGGRRRHGRANSSGPAGGGRSGSASRRDRSDAGSAAMPGVAAAAARRRLRRARAQPGVEPAAILAARVGTGRARDPVRGRRTVARGDLHRARRPAGRRRRRPPDRRTGPTAADARRDAA